MEVNISKKKIAIVANSAWNINNFRLPLIDELARESDVYILTPDTDLLKTRKEVHKVPLFYLDDQSTNPKKEVQALNELRKKISEISPDLCLLFTIKAVIYGNMICANREIKTISTVTGMGHTFIFNSIKNSILRKAYIQSLKSSSKIVVQNDDDEKFLEERVNNETKIIHIPGSGVDVDLFTPKKDRSEGFSFLFVGRCIYEKGLHEFSKAIQLVQSEGFHFNVTIAGKWMEADRYLKTEDWKHLINQKRVNYIGISENIQEVLSKADVLVLPSYREGLSRAILEAMSMEIPVITTNVPGCRQLIQNNYNGWVVNARDEMSLAEAMIEALQSTPNQRRKMGKNSRKEILSKYDARLIVGQYKNLINETLSQSD